MVILGVQKNITDYIRDNGIRQNYVAEKAGIKPNKFSLIMNMKRKLQLDDFVSMCRAINKEPNDFV